MIRGTGYDSLSLVPDISINHLLYQFHYSSVLDSDCFKRDQLSSNLLLNCHLVAHWDLVMTHSCQERMTLS